MPHPTADRNFRLPTSIRPSRYQAHLRIDMEAKRFEGQQTISLELKSDTPEIVLHAVDLSLQDVAFRQGSKTVKATVEVAPVSESVVLRFEQPLSSGTGELEVKWTGAFSP